MAEVAVDKKALIEGERPMLNASYGKLMMWFFLVSDAFTFSGLLIAYGALRVRAGSQGLAWADPEAVFTHTPLLYELFHIEAPLVFVGIMTFILILSSVTMVLAVEAGHRKSRKEVQKWVLLTILGGATFLSCQAYEWYHFIIGTHNGAVILTADELAGVNVGGAETAEGVAVFPVMSREEPGQPQEVLEVRMRNGIRITNPAVISRVNDIVSNPDQYHERFTDGGANMKANEYGPPAFANLFFFVTGFHGTHVFSGVVLLVILFLNVKKGTYEKRGHYEMTEKIGLYWHFVDLVWVFVFTFFYLV